MEPPPLPFVIHHQLQRRLLALCRSRQSRRRQLLPRSIMTITRTQDLQDIRSLTARLNRESKKNIPAEILDHRCTSSHTGHTPPPPARAPSNLQGTLIPNADDYVDSFESFLAGRRADADSRPKQVGKFLRELGPFLPCDGNGKTLFPPSCIGALHH